MHALAQGDSPKSRHACILVSMNAPTFRLVWALYVERFTSGMTQAQIGNLAGVDQSTVGRWLRSVTDPDPRAVIRFARNLERSPLEALVAAGLLNIEEAEHGVSREELRVLIELAKQASSEFWEENDQTGRTPEQIKEDIRIETDAVLRDIDENPIRATFTPDFKLVYVPEGKKQESPAWREWLLAALRDYGTEHADSTDPWRLIVNASRPGVSVVDGAEVGTHHIFIGGGGATGASDEYRLQFGDPDAPAEEIPQDIVDRPRQGSGRGRRPHPSDFDELDEAARNEDREKDRME